MKCFYFKTNKNLLEDSEMYKTFFIFLIKGKKQSISGNANGTLMIFIDDNNKRLSIPVLPDCFLLSFEDNFIKDNKCFVKSMHIVSVQFTIEKTCNFALKSVEFVFNNPSVH